MVSDDSRLQHVQQAYAAGQVLEEAYEDLGALAQARHPEAKRILVQMLGSESALEREKALLLLPSNFELSAETQDTIRALVTDDEDEDVRTFAAVSMGDFGVWPEPVLQRALTEDSHTNVRAAALTAILLLRGVSFADASKEAASVRAGEREPSLEELERLVAKLGGK